MGSPVGWRDLLADAIVYAREGFSASAGQRTPPPREPDLFGPEALPEIRRDLWPLYHPDALARGPLIQTDLAGTIEAVAAGGPEAFYRGDVGRRIAAAASAAGSPLAIEDFAEHRSEWVEPLTIRYGGGVAVSFPPPTQGMSALAMLGISEAFDMAALPEADYVHVLVEAAKLAFADRDRHLTDPGVHAGEPGGAARARAPQASRAERSRGAARCHPAMRRRPRATPSPSPPPTGRAMPCRSSSRSTSPGARRSWRAIPAWSCKIAAASSPSTRPPPMRSSPAS